MLKKIALLGLMVTLGAALAAPAFASQAVQGAVGNILPTDNTAFAGSAACRVYSLSDPGMNNNVAGTCLNSRCNRPYQAALSLYICNGEVTSAYANDLDNQTFYELVDAQAFGGACNHTAFYAVQGQVTQSAGAPTGDFRSDGCPGAAAANCFERASTGDGRTTPLLNVNAGYSGPHTTSSAGGLSPVPTVRVANPGPGCPPGQTRLTWDNPELYSSTMKNGVQSPVKGVRLYTNLSPCGQCPDGNTGWIPGAAFDATAGTVGTCVNKAGDTWYALTVRLRGPGTDPNSEIETGRVGVTGFVGANSQCSNTSSTAVKIANLSTRYAGRGTVNVNFTTGLEGGVQGYYVSRGSSPNGPFSRVSEQLSPRGDGSSYTFSDKIRSALGRTLYYTVEIVNADGTTEHSGASAVNLPAAKRKLSAH